MQVQFRRGKKRKEVPVVVATKAERRPGVTHRVGQREWTEKSLKWTARVATLFTSKKKSYKKLFIFFPFLVSRLSSSAPSGQSGLWSSWRIALTTAFI